MDIADDNIEQLPLDIDMNMVPPYLALHRLESFFDATRGQILSGGQILDLAKHHAPKNDQTSILRALRFLGFLDPEDRPTSVFQQYGASSVAGQEQMLRDIMDRSYAVQMPLLREGKYEAVKASFTPASLSEGVRARCFTFLTQLAKKANLTLPPAERSAGSAPAPQRQPLAEPQARPRAAASPEEPAATLKIPVDLGHGFLCTLTYVGPSPVSPEILQHLSSLIQRLTPPDPTPTAPSLPPHHVSQ